MPQPNIPNFPGNPKELEGVEKALLALSYGVHVIGSRDMDAVGELEHGLLGPGDLFGAAGEGWKLGVGQGGILVRCGSMVPRARLSGQGAARQRRSQNDSLRLPSR